MTRLEDRICELNGMLEKLKNICFNITKDYVPVKKCYTTKGRKGRRIHRDCKLFMPNRSCKKK